MTNNVVQELIDKNIDKDFIESLYRGDKFWNQRKIADFLSRKFNREDICPKHIAELLNIFEIPVWNKTDMNTAQRINPIGESYIKNRVNQLKQAGFSIDYLENLYKNGKSKNEIIDLVNEKSENNILNKKSLKNLWDHFNLFSRDSETDNILRMEKVNESQREKLAKEKVYGTGFSADELVNMYLSGMSINSVAEKTGSNYTTIVKLVKNSGHEIRKKINTNRHSAEEMVEKMKEVGLDENWIKNTLPKMSISKIAELINEKTRMNLLNRNSFHKVTDYYGINISDYSRRVMKSDSDEKTFGYKNLTKQDVIDKHIKEKMSLAEINNKFGVSQYITTKLLREENIPVIKQKKVTDLIKEMNDMGVTEDLLKEKYLQENCTQDEAIEWINSITNLGVTARTFQKMVKILNMRKNDNQRIESQGKKSRKELLDNLEKLKKAGFDSREALAKHYESNLSLTKRTLAEQLNNKIGEDFFSVRWFGRHLDPFLSEDRLKGVSRVENEFREELEKRFDNKNFTYNNRSLIKPYELDIVDFDSKTAIEFNGNYWHSDKFLLANHNMTSVEYHTMKELLCKDIGFTVLFVWEYDWESDPDSVLKAIDEYFISGTISPLLSKKEYC